MNTRLLKLADSNQKRVKQAVIVTFILTFAVTTIFGYYTFTNGPTKTVETKNTYTVSQQVTTSLTVTDDTNLYEEGETIKNAALYPKQHTTAPTITLTTKTPTQASPINISQKITVIMTAKANGSAYWSNTHIFNTTQKQVTDTDKNTVTTQTQLSITSLAEKAQTVKETYGNQGIITAEVHFTTTYTDSVGTRQITTTLPIRISDKAFAIGSGKSHAKNQYNTHTTETRPNKTLYGLLKYLTIFFITLTGVGLLGYIKSDPSRTETDYIFLEYDEWVNSVTNTDQPHEDPTIHDSFDTLIHTARSANTPVIYDTSTGVFQAKINESYHTYTPSNSSPVSSNQNAGDIDESK